MHFVSREDEVVDLPADSEWEASEEKLRLMMSRCCVTLSFKDLVCF